MKILNIKLYVVLFFYLLKYSENPYIETYNKNDNLYKNFYLIIDIPNNFKELKKKICPDYFEFLIIKFFGSKKNPRIISFDRCLAK